MSRLDKGDRRSDTRNDAEEERSIKDIRDALRGLRYGSVLVIVQDGVVVQLDRTEKRRLRKSDTSQKILQDPSP